MESDAEPMDLRHYDNVAHDLNASYEDVQEGMSTPYGIARTTTLTLIPRGGYSGKKAFAEQAKQLAGPGVLMPVPTICMPSRRLVFGAFPIVVLLSVPGWKTGWMLISASIKKR